MGHVLEHVVIELLNLAGMPTGFGQTRSTSQRGVYRMVFRARDESVARCALAEGHALLMAAINEQTFDVGAAVDRVRDCIDRAYLGPSTAHIVAAATERRIPHLRLNDGNLVQLGQGARQRRIWTAETDRTSAIAEGIARDKDLTKQLLKAVGVPVPEGQVAASAAEAWDAAQDIGLPVVVKPSDGNHGRGVTLDLHEREHVEAAWEVADRHGSEVLVERFVPGQSTGCWSSPARVVAAARGETAWVTGDGVHDVQALVDAQINSDPRRGTTEDHPLDPADARRCRHRAPTWQRQGLSAEAVPAAGRRVLIQRNGNVAIDCTDEVHPEVAHQVALAARTRRPGHRRHRPRRRGHRAAAARAGCRGGRGQCRAGAADAPEARRRRSRGRWAGRSSTTSLPPAMTGASRWSALPAARTRRSSRATWPGCCSLSAGRSAWPAATGCSSATARSSRSTPPRWALARRLLINRDDRRGGVRERRAIDPCAGPGLRPLPGRRGHRPGRRRRAGRIRHPGGRPVAQGAAHPGRRRARRRGGCAQRRRAAHCRAGRVLRRRGDALRDTGGCAGGALRRRRPRRALARRAPGAAPWRRRDPARLAPPIPRGLAADDGAGHRRGGLGLRPGAALDQCRPGHLPQRENLDGRHPHPRAARPEPVEPTHGDRSHRALCCRRERGGAQRAAGAAPARAVPRAGRAARRW